MFTEGLDPHALRWVREQRTDHLHGLRNGGRGLGIPPPEKFRSGHLPHSAVHLSRTMPLDEYSEAGSDMDVSSDTEEEIYGGKYSLESSPQNDISQRKVPNGTTGIVRQNHYYSDGYSDLSSSRGTVPQPVRQQWKQGSMSGYTGEEEEGSPETCGSSGFVAGLRRGDGVGNSYSSKSRFRDNLSVSAVEGAVDVPSAPPFHGSHIEINLAVDPSTSSIACDTPCKAGFNDFSAKRNGICSQANSGSKKTHQNMSSNSVGPETSVPLKNLPLKVPTFHACGQGPWHSVIAYDACVRLCLHSWARGCMEAPIFLENECSLLRNAFSLQHILLQSEEELLEKRSSELLEGAAVKPKKIIGKMKIQARKVRMSLDMPSGCNYVSLRSPTVKLESFRHCMSNFQSTVSSGWESLRKVRFLPHPPADNSFSKQSLAYMQASTQYIKQVSALLKTGVSSLRSASSAYETVQESFSCLLRLKSLAEEDKVRVQVGSGETHVFFPDSMGDDLIVEVYDSKGKNLGRVIVQLAIVAEDPNNKVRWWSIYREPEHELVGRMQLYVNYSTTTDENSSLKCGSVAETVAYDIVLEVAMKVQQFQQRNLLLHGPWKWLLAEFASYYGVSDAYTRLRYLSYIMDVATPTADCLTLVHSLLAPVHLRNGSIKALSHQENRILGDIEEQIEVVLAMVFENYKSLDEASPSGVLEVYRPSTGIPAAALLPAVNLYKLLHDILSPEAQLKLCSYFQVAAKKRSRIQLSETDEFIGSCTSGSNGGTAMEALTVSTAYEKMKNVCLNIRNEIFTDIEIHDQHVLPSFVDLRNISASIYSVELCNRLREFLGACPPAGPSPHVADLVIATADFQKDLSNWNICHVKGGVDAKELFHLYIIFWIQDKRLQLLESCKLDKVKWSGVRTQHMTTPFVDGMYDLLRDTLNEYEVIICRWPEYTAVLENAIADVEKAIIEALERQYADVLAPLKDALTPKKFGLKYVQKLAKRSNVGPYTVTDELGVLLNSMKRLLDVLRPKIEAQFKSWASYMPDGGNTSVGEHLSEVTVTLRAKFRNYVQAVVEKLLENSRAQSATKLKKIVQDSKDVIVESDIRNRMQPLKDQLMETINHLHTILEAHVFVSLCRCFWDRMGQDVLNFLEDRKENRSWYKSARVTVAILDDTFASQMQQLLGNALQLKDLEPPRSIMEVRSVLCKDVSSHKDSKFYY